MDEYILYNFKLFPRVILPWSTPLWSSLIAQLVKNLPTMQETRVRFLDRKDPLEKEMAILSSILAWRIPWTAKPSRLQSTGLQRVGHDWATSPHLDCIIGYRVWSLEANNRVSWMHLILVIFTRFCFSLVTVESFSNLILWWYHCHNYLNFYL